MAEQKTTTEPDQPDDDEALRRRLLRRIAIAGALVVVLVGGLAIFDALYVPTEQAPERLAALAPAEAPAPKPAEKPAEAAAETPAEAAKPTETTAVLEATKPEVAAKPGEAAKAAEPPAEPERSAAPTGTLPPARGERPLTVPAQARPAIMKPAEPLVPVQKPEPAKEIARSGPPAAARPLSQALASGRNYLLQMGVFNNVANAEELRARLELAGVPTQIEARVQVGPFSTRQEAELAREKLKSLGLEPGILMTNRK